jgi:L-ascorbate metabolism protein UlaG (beta-lactamase superfamily)
MKWLLVVIIFAGCSSMYVEGHKGPKTENFDGRVFKNLEPISPHGFWGFIKWQMSGGKSEWPDWVDSPQSSKKIESLQANKTQVTFINHASFLIQIGAVNVLTDPIWSERCSPFTWVGPKRHRRPGVRFEDLPPIHVVIVSHNHYEHMDLESLKLLDQKHQPLFLVGLGNKAFLERHGINNVQEFDWWGSQEIKGVNFTFVPVQHFSGRGLNDRFKTLWGGFVLDSKRHKMLFAGDTGYASHFRQIREKFGPMDLSLLPIGAYEPRWFMKDMHMNPADAVQAHLDLESKLSIGMHFGTFKLTDEAIDDPGKHLEEAKTKRSLKPQEFLTPEFGQTFSLGS